MCKSTVRSFFSLLLIEGFLFGGTTSEGGVVKSVHCLRRPYVHAYVARGRSYGDSADSDRQYAIQQFLPNAIERLVGRCFVKHSFEHTGSEKKITYTEPANVDRSLFRAAIARDIFYQLTGCYFKRYDTTDWKRGAVLGIYAIRCKGSKGDRELFVDEAGKALSGWYTVYTR